MAKRRRIAVRRSSIHGRGVFATARIRRGSLVVEYAGERLTDEQVRRRYGRRRETGHTMLFQLDEATTIDPTRRGNIARFINHGCDGNCRAVMIGERIFIEAIRNIQPGVELTYDYQIVPAGPASGSGAALYACRCGSARCRGSMLQAQRQPGGRRKGRK